MKHDTHFKEREGLVVRAVGGFCWVTLHDDNTTLQCQLRGRLKQRHERILPGDIVRVSALSDTEGVVEEVLPRRSVLRRPHVANVDHVVIVVSISQPQPNLMLLDKTIVAAYFEGLEVSIVWNKIDLLSADEYKDNPIQVYEKAGFHTVTTSAHTGAGREQFHAMLAEHVSVLAGASGVGKSSLVNALLGEERFATGEVSERIQRGRHTTRTVELVPVSENGWLADAPGFSVVDLSGIPKERLSQAYPEMRELNHQCRFSACYHRQEPACAVREAVENGTIDAERYERYLRIFDEVEKLEAEQY